MIKIRTEVNEIEKRKITEKIGWFFFKINKSDKTLARLTKKKERAFK